MSLSAADRRLGSSVVCLGVAPSRKAKEQAVLVCEESVCKYVLPNANAPVLRFEQVSF